MNQQRYVVAFRPSCSNAGAMWGIWLIRVLWPPSRRCRRSGRACGTRYCLSTLNDLPHPWPRSESIPSLPYSPPFRLTTELPNLLGKEYPYGLLRCVVQRIGKPTDSSRMPPAPTRNQSNPACSRDELVLALNLCLLHRNGLPGKRQPDLKMDTCPS